MKKSNSVGKIVVILVIIAVIAVAAVLVVMNLNKNQENKGSDKPVATQAATEITITPADQEDSELFLKSLPGTWSSYTKDGVAYTYTFEEDGSVHYKKDGENASDFTYTVEKGIFTIKRSDRSFAYQLSKDAVTMMADLNYGQIKNLFAKTEETIHDFNGCVYIADDVMYMGTVCLFRDKGIKSDDASLEGEWLGVVGDRLTVNADGTFNYINNAEKTKGELSVGDDGKTLIHKLGDKSTEFDETEWGIKGNVLHIQKQYYFKLSD